VDLIDAGRLQRTAPVRVAALIAVVVRLAVLLAPAPAAAQPPAAVQFGVQDVEDVHPHLDLAELHAAEHRPDDPLDIALVPGPGVELRLGDFQPAVEQVADSGLGLRLAALADLLDQVGPLGLGSSAEDAES
jgi:hypothetical protein